MKAPSCPTALVVRLFCRHASKRAWPKRRHVWPVAEESLSLLVKLVVSRLVSSYSYLTVATSRGESEFGGQWPRRLARANWKRQTSKRAPEG